MVMRDQSKRTALAAAETTAILDYGASKLKLVTTNHGHHFGPAINTALYRSTDQRSDPISYTG
jgi:hypothetical protein